MKDCQNTQFGDVWLICFSKWPPKCIYFYGCSIAICVQGGRRPSPQMHMVQQLRTNLNEDKEENNDGDDCDDSGDGDDDDDGDVDGDDGDGGDGEVNVQDD